MCMFRRACLAGNLPGYLVDNSRRINEHTFARPALWRADIAQGSRLHSRASADGDDSPRVELIIEGRPALSPGERQPSDLLVISPDYFKTIGAPLRTGRAFTESDGREAPPIVIISELTARRYWPNEDPLGRRVKLGVSNADAPWLTIVGVVSDVRQAWFDKEIRPQLYLPYGVMSYSVAQRTHEIGVRMALGARPRDVLWMIVSQGIKTAWLGLAIGAPLTLGLSRLMASLLFGVVTLDGAVLTGFVSLLAVVAFLSSCIPARRAAKVDPLVALRAE